MWYRRYPLCGSEDSIMQSRLRQSPIDLSDAIYNASLKHLLLRNYQLPSGKWRIEKTKTSIVLYSDGILPFIEMPQSFEFNQAHFHWGSGGRSLVGSEHSIDGKFFPLEVHLVHVNKLTNQIAVLAVLYELSNPKTDKDNPKLDPLLEIIELDINSKEFSRTGGTPILYMRNQFILENLLPENWNTYYRYIGSLTTPPCTENVIWTIIKEKNYLSRRQLYFIERIQQCDSKLRTCFARSSIGPNRRPLQSPYQHKI
ncbi:carbonic anhydrase 6-like [Gordionus sp. m RMFG-2023]|uniref:carbonic anhydrase 6-like n=1 Tax=Gordionus sp. m RMFG-2023 TaxID=3053472 RepID=UPI0031FDD529